MEEEIKKLRKEGYTIQEIAKKLKIDEVTVFNATTQGAKIITEEQRQLMITMKAAGKSNRDIANAIGCSESTVRNRLKAPAKYKAPANYYKISDNDLKAIKKWYLRGKTIAWIADKYGISAASVLNRLKNSKTYKTDYTKNVPLHLTEKIYAQLFKKFKSVDEIANKLGRSYIIISDYLNIFDRNDDK